MNLKKIIAGAFATDDPRYRTASMTSMIFCSAGSGAKQCLYILMMYASYMANVGFGVAVTVTGIILTVKSIFDGGIDPFLAAIYDRMPGRQVRQDAKVYAHRLGDGNIAAILMFSLLAGRVRRLARSDCLYHCLFSVCYWIQYNGNRCYNRSGDFDKQSQAETILKLYCNLLSVYCSYGTYHSNVISILPKYDNQYNAGCLWEKRYGYMLVYRQY